MEKVKLGKELVKPKEFDKDLIPERLRGVFEKFSHWFQDALQQKNEDFLRQISETFKIDIEEIFKNSDLIIEIFYWLIIFSTPLNDLDIEKLNKAINKIKPSIFNKVREIWNNNPQGITFVFKKREIALVTPGRNYYFSMLEKFNRWRQLSGLSLEPPRELAINEDSLSYRKKEETKTRERYLSFLDSQLFLLLGKENYQKFLKYYRARSYREFLENLNKDLPPMESDCRVVVILPARLEEKTIRNVLQGYLNQKDNQGKLIDKSLFEIIILVNRLERERDDRTEEIIENFNKEHPELRIRKIKIVFPENNDQIANVGMCRKIISDLAILRSQKNKKPFYFITEDADTLYIDPLLIHRTIERFDKNYKLDALRGVELRADPRLKDLMIFLFLLYLNSAVSLFFKAKRNSLKDPNDFTQNEIFRWHRVITGGWSTAFTFEALMKIGGYLPFKMGEDLSIGERISFFRGKEIESKWGRIIQPNNETVDFFNIKSIGSVRRFLAEFIKRIETAYSSEFGSLGEVYILRNLEEDLENVIPELKEKGLNDINETTKKLIEEKLTYLKIFMLNVLGEEGQRSFRRYMNLFLGFKNNEWRLENNQVVILNENKLKEIFEKFKEKMSKTFDQIKVTITFPI